MMFASKRERNMAVAKKEPVQVFILKDLRIVEPLDGQKARNKELFKQAFEKMNKARLYRTKRKTKNKYGSCAGHNVGPS